LFDRVIVVDWSAANLPTSATNRANAVWIGCHDAEGGAGPRAPQGCAC